MHTTEIEIPIRPLSEIFPHLEFRINTDTSIVYAKTKCHAGMGMFWHFFIGNMSLKKWASMFRDEFTIPCADPCTYKSGQTLVNALHDHESWNKFVEQVTVPDQYTGKLEFYLGYSPEKAPYKEAAYPNSSTGNVTAIRPQSLAGIWFNTYECFTAGHGVEPNAEQIHSIRIGESMLHDRCVQITEKEARIIHPNLFEYLKENFKK